MEVYYKPSDIVWVKLGPFWWPGEVIDKTSVPSDLFESLKKEPVAIVKFFDDDGYYEIVKTPEGIFPYNCDRKLDFIKKGMDAFRAKNPKLASFPKDVSAAEVKTGGNANILSDPVFTTERKRNYAAEIFGSPTVKKPRDSNKARANKSEPIITHRRFLGYDDYEARVLIPQSEEPHLEEEEPMTTVVPREEIFNKFTCPNCQFNTDTLGILMKHTSCHIKDVSFKSRQPIKKPQKRKKRKALSDEDLSGDEKKTKTKRKYTKKKADESILADDERSENDVSLAVKDSPKRKITKKSVQPILEEKKDICIDIIADWDDESNHDDSNEKNSTLNETQETSEVTANDSSLTDTSFILNNTDENVDSISIPKEISEEVNEENLTEDKTEKSANKSCFDFDEDEEDTKIPDATSGRKIPRVIPISERRKTFEFDDEPVNEEEEKKKRMILQESEELAKLTEPPTIVDKETENLEKVYQSLMDSTENIDLPDVPNILKNEQNFHSAKTVKYPDKTKGDSSDLIEAEVVEEKIEVSENTAVEEIPTVEKNMEKPDNVADITSIIDEKLGEQSDLVQIDTLDKEKLVDDESEQSLPKSKIKRRSKYTKKGRKSSRSKREVTESDIDALLLKQSADSENIKDAEEPESATIQVPLNIPSVSTEDVTSEVDLPAESEKIRDVNYQQDVQEESNNTVDTDIINEKNSNSEGILGEKEIDKKQEYEIPVEGATVETKTVDGASPDITDEKNVPTETPKCLPANESLKITENQVELDAEVSKNELNHAEDKIKDDGHQPELKRRKTTRGYSKSTKSKENSTQGNRRGRSRDSKTLKLEESACSLPQGQSPKNEQKSGTSRKSSRWNRKSLSKDDETPEEETLVDYIIPSPQEINTVILGTANLKENITTHIMEPTHLHESSEQKPENDVKLPATKEGEKDSSALLVPSEIPSFEQHNKEVEEIKNIGNEEQIVSNQDINALKTNQNNEVDAFSSGKIEEALDKPTKDHKSRHRSSRKEKRSSRSEKNESNIIPDNSSHQSSRSGRRSSRHEKMKQDSSEGYKTAQQDETSVKHSKQSSTSRKSRSSSSRDTHNRSMEIPINDQEDIVSRRSSRKDKKNLQTDQDSQKFKASPLKDHVVEDQKDHISSSRSSKRHSSRSTRSSKNYFKFPENKEPKSPTDKEPEDSNLLKKEKIVGKAQSSHMKLAGPLKRDEVDPIKDLFAPSENVIKTKEQKREELKSIFSFDYDEKDLKKRKTYGHKRKSKQEKTTTKSKIPQKDKILPESKQFNSAEHKNVESKVDEITSEASSEIMKTSLVEIHKSVPSSLEEGSQSALERIEAQHEAVLAFEKEEKTTVLEQKEQSEVQENEIFVHQEESKDTNENETLIGNELLTNKNQNDKLIEVSDSNIEDTQHKKEHFICEDIKPKDHDTKLNKNEVVLNDTEQIKETEKSPKSITKRNRKPSRWDQKEKTDKNSNQERKSRWDNAKNEEENQFQCLETEPGKETIESNVNSQIDETSQKEMKDIFSEKESSDIAEKNAEQIELIFGSSPLPGLNENSLLVEENLETSSDKKELLTVSHSEEKKNDEVFPSDASSQNSSFENSSDLLESVESQVARITHYEEPNMEKALLNEEKSNEQQKVGSIFDTSEKSEKPTDKYQDSLDDTIDVETNSPTEICSSQTEELSKAKPGSAPKTKKTYLLTEKAKKEKAEQSTSIQDPPVLTKSVEKSNEIATKLTNPKKRFVKSFEDFELNKQKEKSLEAEKPSAHEVKPETSSLPVGKPPIAFKLKKQFLSKISSIFDEADEKKETKLLPKLKQTKNDDKFFAKKKDLVSSEKIVSDTSKSCEALDNPELKPEKSSKIDVVISKKESDKEAISKADHSLSINKSCLEMKELSEGKSEVSQDTDSKIHDTALKVQFTSKNNSVEFSIDSTPTESLEGQDDDLVISKTEIITKNFPLDETKKEETEYVSIDGNLTVVSEKELAEGQVEITASMPSKKPMTLLSFSMDFSDDSSDASFEAFRKEKIQNITESLDSKNVEDENKEKELATCKEKEHIIVSEEKMETTYYNERIGAVDNQDIKQTVDNQDIKQTVDIEKEHVDDKGKKDTLDEPVEEKDLHESENELIFDNKDKGETVVNTEEYTVEEVRHTLENNEKLLEPVPNVIEEFELKTSPSITTSQLHEENDKTETKKEGTNISKFSSKSNTKEDIKDADCNTLPILSEVKTVAKSTESVTMRTKGKDSSKKKLLTTEDVPVVNEPLVIYNTAKSSTVTDMCDLEDHIPSQIVCTKNALINEEVMKVAGINNELTKDGSIPKTEPEMSKLLSRLTTDKKEDSVPKIKVTESYAKMRDFDPKTLKSEQTVSKNLLKTVIKSKSINTNIIPPPKSVNKAIILSEKIIRPAREVATSGNIASKRTYEDVEDIEPYVITKAPKLELKKEEISGSQKVLAAVSKLSGNSPKQFIMNANKQVIGIKKSSGKAKILNQTIIRPAGETIQNKVLTGTEDNVDFDINSMPIVLSDELLTPESLENIPIVLGEQAQKAIPVNEKMKIIIDKKPQSTSKLLTKTVSVSSASASPTVRMPIMKRTAPKILQTPKPTQKIIRQLTPTVGSKSGKFVVVSDSPNRPAQIMKKQPNLLRRTTPVTCVASSAPGNPSESTGHKIMIFTNQQGKQQRLLLTPAQQKMFGMQLPGKTVVKSATVAQKSQIAKVQTSNSASTSKLPGQSIQSPKLVKTTVGAAQVPSPHMKIVPPRKNQKLYVPGMQMSKPPQQRTILITNQHGQTVRKIQGTNEALLDKQVAEQLEAIKVSSMKAQQKQQEANARTTVSNKPTTVAMRKSTVKRPEPKPTGVTQTKQTVVGQTKPSHPSIPTISGPSRLTEQRVPPLSPIKQEKKSEDLQKHTTQNKPERPLHQLVIQDNMGNQTTITEGQILALPSETVDGQPQSYMLVTLDETGNLTPLNNEALMSLDPSLAGLAGGDLSNMVLQMDAGTSKDNVNQTGPPTLTVQEKRKQEVKPLAPPKPVQQVVPPMEQAATQVQVTCNINGEPGQQIILTGDPVATQKFLDSLSDGSTDLTNILAGAEGNSFLIQADGQQILINTEPTEAPIIQQNPSIIEQPEQGNPMFSTHPVKNQDILAAALADTDVFQQDQVSSQGKITHSQISPGQTLFPMNVGNVLETSLTLNSPIMTPLEVPSTNSKRIPDEADILTKHVPKNVDLPITITDPNISQTVSHQQVLMASDLQSNLELSLPISETSMSVTSDMNSPSFVYSLPNLDVSDHAEISQKTFSSSMPLLTEDVEESSAFVPAPSNAIELQGSVILGRAESSVVTKKHNSEREHKRGIVEAMGTRRMVSGGMFMEEGLCTLGAEMCSSLSEPPPEMFDIPMEKDGLNFLNKSQIESKDKSNLSTVDSSLLTDDYSLEIPVQSQIVSDFKDSSQSSDSSSSVSQDKTL